MMVTAWDSSPKPSRLHGALPIRAWQVTNASWVAACHLPPANDNGISLDRRVAAMAPWFIPVVVFTALLWLAAA